MSKKALSSLVTVLAVGFALVGSVHAANPPAKHPASGAPAGKAHLVAVSELKWNDVAGFPGVQTAVLHGDPAKGPSHFFLKLPGGFDSGMHFHSADHWGAVVSGTVSLTPEGEAEKQLPAGSGFSFTGKKKHNTKCAAGADCVIFVDSRGKWDVVPVK